MPKRPTEELVKNKFRETKTEMDSVFRLCDYQSLGVIRRHVERFLL